MRRHVTSDDPYEDEDFELLDADRSYVVTTPDGVPLAVREVGPKDAPLTVVFVHGFCLRMGAFHFQRDRLAEQWGPQVRMVFYDQRGHGQSAEASPDSYTVTQLGQDLETVLAVMARRGPVVLVGHSMGGMTVLSHAGQYPHRYPTRIVGAALIASAAEGVSRSPLGEILKNPALEAARFAVRHAPKTVHRTRGAAKSVIGPILRAASYGDEKISPSVVAFSEKMMHDTPMATLVEFLHALEVHDETPALPTLAKVPTLIACGDRDLLTPVEHSQSMAAALPKSELVIVGGAGHLVQLEAPEPIDDALVRLVERATPSKLVALTRRVRDRVRNHG
jgi:pimeloyl-ACP methyl ester carboxylesterase